MGVAILDTGLLDSSSLISLTACVFVFDLLIYSNDPFLIGPIDE